jgi:large subunit ribosomal protein L32
MLLLKVCNTTMGVPTQRRTKSQRNQRRMHIFTKVPALTICPKCGSSVLPHTVCQNCGYYRGKEAINVLEKLEKKERKKREKEIKAQEKSEKKEKSLSAEELSKK